MGIFSDYPHFYNLTKEGSLQTMLYAMRGSENGEFIISNQEGVFCLYGPNFLGVLRPNMLGTHFEMFDCGMDANLLKQLPKDFYPHQKLI